MKSELMYWSQEIWKVLQINKSWMTWNLFLALIPLALSIALFRERRWRPYLWGILFLLGLTFVPKGQYYLLHGMRFLRDNLTNYIAWAIALVLIVLDLWVLRQPGKRSLHWWAGFLVFVAFLPNAPYLLTDVIHLVDDIRNIPSIWLISLVLIPQYLLVILTGFEAYVLSLINLGDYLNRQGLGKYILWAELVFHALSAIGIYLGRFLRFNSWDIVTNLDTLTSSIEELVGKWPVLVMLVTFVVITGLYWLMKQVTLAIAAYQQNSKFNSSTVNSLARR